MWKKICLLVFLTFVTINLLFTSSQSQNRHREAIAQTNSCVACHSTTFTPVELGNRYLQWRFSAHQDKHVGCDKCHGGNPSAIGKLQSHEGILPAVDLKSRINQWNLPETCSACHEAVVKPFVNSAHYQRLKSSGTGPSCTTCHSHMAAGVIYSPDELSNLCSSCHATINGVAPTRLDIAKRAKEVMSSLQRADYLVSWANLLLEKAKERKLNVKLEQQEMIAVNDLMKATLAEWHSFELESVDQKFDLIFLKAKAVKERLAMRLN